MADHDDDNIKLALLAHDLRTPLAAMRLTGELIGNGPLNAAQTGQLSILIRAIDALTQMTGDLVQDAMPENRLPADSVSVLSVVRETCDLYKIAARAKGLDCLIHEDDGVEKTATEKGGQLRRAVTTLLDNAVKYTEQGGVEVRVGFCPAPDAGGSNGADASRDPEASGRDPADDPWILVSITDTGPGIDAEDRAQLFRPFARGRQGRRNGPGTGLGLWGAARMVRQMGGRLTLTQPAPGGSRFEIKVPVEKKRSGGADPVFADTDPDVRTGAPAALPGHVLIVDDNETNCRLLAALLESFGISSEAVQSGEEALERVGSRAFGAVLLDLNMPGMSGLQTAKALRGRQDGAALPLIAVTAGLEAIGDKRLRQAGFQEVLSKPLSPAALYKAMQEAVRRTSGAPAEDQRPMP